MRQNSYGRYVTPPVYLPDFSTERIMVFGRLPFHTIRFSLHLLLVDFLPQLEQSTNPETIL